MEATEAMVVVVVWWWRDEADCLGGRVRRMSERSGRRQFVEVTCGVRGDRESPK